MAAPARTIAELLARRAAEHPERAAIRAPGRGALAYGELAAIADATAAALRARGIGPTDRVALALPNGPEAAVAFLAVAAAAGCAPLPPDAREDDLAASLGELRVTALLVGGEPLPAAVAAAERQGVPVLRLVVRGDGAGAFAIAGASPATAGALAGAREGASDGSAGGAVAPGDVALVLQTSGTTARPKTVPLTHANLVASAANIRRSLELGPADVCLNVMPLFHVHGLMAALLASIDAGASVVCTPGFRAGEFPVWLRDFGATWYTAVPTIHQAVLDACRDRAALAGSRLRLVRSSSAALPPSVLRALEELFAVPVIEAYGMTEASHQMASNPLAPGAQKPGSVGLAAGAEIAVMDAGGRLLARDEVGELVIRGETVTRGYEGSDAANAAAFTGGWFRTGDQGYVDADGYVFLTGRLKELINRGGEKIAPREVEEALLRHPAVARAVAFGAPHPRLGEEVAAAVVLRDGASATRDDLQRAAQEHLATFKVPRRIAIVAEIPTGATGKVQRSTLARALGLGEAASGGGRAPTSALERRIAASWSAFLDGREPSLDDDFFALGGDSLGAAQLLDEMSVLLGFEVPVADFLARPTIAGLLALRVQACAAGGEDRGELVRLRSGGAEPPIFCTPLHDGSLWGAARLARHIGIDCAVYGLPAPPVTARGAPPTIEELAERSIAALERTQPDGPVRLVGPCFGGTVALEMAIRLERRGRTVELLAMLNSFNRGWRSTEPGAIGLGLRARHLAERVRLHAARLRALDRGERAAYLRARAELARAHWTRESARGLFELAVATGLPRPAPLRQVAHASRHAQRRYAPRPYDGRVLMVRAVAPIAGVYPLPYMGWGRALRGEVELLDLPCEQLELWRDDRVLARVAARIGEMLASAGRSAA